jgi:hypothetical protein
VNEDGYLVITIATGVFLLAIVLITLIEIFQTRRQHKEAIRLLRQAQKEVATALTAAPGAVNVDELQVLRDVLEANSAPSLLE